MPLGLGVMVLKQSSQAQLEQDAALESEAGAAAARLRDSVAETRATVLITAHNPAFRDFYRAGGDRYAKIVGGGPTMDRVNGALLYLAGLSREHRRGVVRRRQRRRECPHRSWQPRSAARARRRRLA